MTTVLLLRTWITNIGNGFIDKGAKSIIQQSFPDAKIIEVSGLSNLAHKQHSKGEFAGAGQIINDFGGKDGFRGLRQSVRSEITSSTVDSTASVTNVADFVDADLAVFPGCILEDHGLGSYYPTLKKLSENAVPIVLLGAGGSDYEPETISQVSEMLSSLNVTGLITRDEIAYSKYNGVIEDTENGIDCAFFINDWHQPPESTRPFIAATFDKGPEPSLSTEKLVIRPDHSPFGEDVLHGGIPYKVWQRVKGYRNSEKGNVFVSDQLTDYLFYYGNADVTVSDRIHACVPTLMYGNKAVFTYETPRANLFDRVGASTIREEPTSIDEDRIAELKSKQIETFRDFATRAMNIQVS